MAQKIVWTERALEDFEQVKSYILSEFGTVVFSKFLSSFLRKINLISNSPFLYPATSHKKYTRKAVVNKRLILFYRYKPRKNEIEIISLWNTRRKSATNKGKN